MQGVPLAFADTWRWAPFCYQLPSDSSTVAMAILQDPRVGVLDCDLYVDSLNCRTPFCSLC